MSTWQLADAEAHFREVVDKALREGPQTISDNGTGVVVVSADEYQAMAKAKPDFISFLLDGPLVDDFTIERDIDTGRDVDL
jgi:antitoxin Phd